MTKSSEGKMSGDDIRKNRSQRARKPRASRGDLPDKYAPGHCTMCQIRWGQFDQPEDTVRVIRELQDILEWLFYMRKYTNMTSPDGLDPRE